MSTSIQILRTILGIAWALWFGGMIALLIFVIQLFKTSHDTGVIGAPVLFRTFATYQMILGAMCLALALVMRLRFIVLFIAISLALAIPIRSWTTQMETMRALGQSQSDEFKSLHGRSSMAYTVSAIALLAAGIGLSLRSGKLEQLEQPHG